MLWWPYAKSGLFSVKSGYQVLKQNVQESVLYPSTSRSASENTWKIVWGSKVPQKIKMFMWRVCLNILPVRENLRKKKVVPNAICPICQKEQETIEHALLLCSWTRPVWFGSQVQCTPDPRNVTSIVNWLEDSILRLQNNPDFFQFGLTVVFTTLWQIWKSRNAVVFENKNICPFGTLTQANLLISDYNSVQQERVGEERISQRAGSGACGWRPPLGETLKINSDASFHKLTSSSVSGIIVRNATGDVVSGLTKKHRTSSALTAEALALRDAMTLASNLFIDKVVFESDCLELVQTCRGEINRGEISSIMQDVFSLKNNFQRCGFTWVNRSGNELAHQIAALASRDLLPHNWIFNQPLVVKNQISKDRGYVALRRPNLASEEH